MHILLQWLTVFAILVALIYELRAGISSIAYQLVKDGLIWNCDKALAREQAFRLWFKFCAMIYIAGALWSVAQFI